MTKAKRRISERREQINKEANDFILTLNVNRYENITVKNSGGIYEDRDRILLKILNTCDNNFKISYNTEHISECAAYRNFNLKSVHFPFSIRSIGARAFWGCTNIKSYSCGVSTNIVIIGEKAFMNCKSVECISKEFLKSVRFVGRGAFSGMDKLKEIYLPEGLLEIPAFCFGCDDSLKEINLPSTVTKIDDGAFFCTGLEMIKIPDSVLELGDFIFSACRKLKTVQLPKHITRIPCRTFSSCKSLVHIDIPSSVKYVEDLAFEGATSLKSIRFRGKVNTIIPSAFKDSAIETIIAPWYLKRYYKRLFPQATFKSKII